MNGSIRRISTAVIIGFTLVMIGTIGLPTRSYAAQDLETLVAISAVAGVEGASCAIEANINRIGRGNYVGSRSMRAADYDRCKWQAEARRQQAYHQQQAELRQARYEARQNAPRCRYYEQNGQQYRTCTETVYGQWRQR